MYATVQYDMIEKQVDFFLPWKTKYYKNITNNNSPP